MNCAYAPPNVSAGSSYTCFSAASCFTAMTLQFVKKRNCVLRLIAVTTLPSIDPGRTAEKRRTYCNMTHLYVIPVIQQARTEFRQFGGDCDLRSSTNLDTYCESSRRPHRHAWPQLQQVSPRCVALHATPHASEGPLTGSLPQGSDQVGTRGTACQRD